jgi:hypothetical protein
LSIRLVFFALYSFGHLLAHPITHRDARAKKKEAREIAGQNKKEKDQEREKKKQQQILQQIQQKQREVVVSAAEPRNRRRQTFTGALWSRVRVPLSTAMAVTRSWLQAEATNDHQYCPQKGDRVMYFPQGHKEMLSQFAENNYSPPWLQLQKGCPLFECVVRDVNYEFPTEQGEDLLLLLLSLSLLLF